MTSRGETRRLPRLACVAGLIAGALLLSPTVAAAQVAPAAIQASFERGSKRDEELRQFYRARGWRPVWLAGSGLAPAADSLVRVVARADADGLDRRTLDFGGVVAILQRAQQKASPRELARADVALSRLFAAYVRATRMQRDAGMSYQSPALAPAVPSVAEALVEALAAPSLSEYVARLGWMHPLYAELRQALIASPLDGERERLVRLNLERARALPGNPGPRYVLVDAAGARLWMYEGGKPVDSMKVVVGKPDQPTPMLAGHLTEAVLNPYWNVPVDLAQTRVATEVLKRGLPYLRGGGYQVLSDFSDDARLLDPATIDWKAVADGRRELRVRQLPGRANFMGKVKFNFPNPDGIYLHDTPEKALLKAEVRTASAGCVRLEDAARFGRWLFGRTLTAQGSQPEQKVPLDQPVPVYITYLTASAVDGRIVFRDDVYGRDERQLAALNGGDEPRPASRDALGLVSESAFPR